MKQLSKKIAALILASIFVAGCLAACGGGGSAQPAAESQAADTTAAADSQAEAPAASGEFSFAGDIVGQGGAALDLFVSEMQYNFENAGYSFQIYNDNFTADTQMQNVETMASGNYNGLLIYGWNTAAYEQISSVLGSAKKPFAMFDQIPNDDSVIEMLNNNEYYLGCVGTDSFAEGVQAAEQMLSNGVKEALILGGSVGDTIHDKRVAGFEEAFTKGGGKLLAAARCTDPSEATQKCDDLLVANNSAQAIYALSGDYAVAAIAALGNHSDIDMAIYVSGATAENIPYIKDGTIAYADSGSKIVIPIASALLINYAKGNQILDENGKAPHFNNVVPFAITADNADDFAKYYLEGHPLTADQFAELIADGVTYQTFVDFIDNYGLETSTK